MHQWLSISGLKFAKAIFFDKSKKPSSKKFRKEQTID